MVLHHTLNAPYWAKGKSLGLISDAKSFERNL